MRYNEVGVINMKLRLKEVRLARGLTQKQVAAAIGVSLSSYRAYELGRRGFTSKELKDLALFYKISSDYLVGLADFPRVIP